MGKRRGFLLLPASLAAVALAAVALATVALAAVALAAVALAAVALAAVALIPKAAWACPMCYGSSDSRVLETYYLSTIMLSLLPFAVMGSILLVGLHVRRQAHARAMRESEEFGPGLPG